MSKFYVCKHCHSKIHVSYLAQHTMRKHIAQNYEIVEYDSQTVFEIQNDQVTGKIELTEQEANKKYGFSV